MVARLSRRLASSAACGDSVQRAHGIEKYSLRLGSAARERARRPGSRRRRRAEATFSNSPLAAHELENGSSARSTSPHTLQASCARKPASPAHPAASHRRTAQSESLLWSPRNDANALRSSTTWRLRAFSPTTGLDPLVPESRSPSSSDESACTRLPSRRPVLFGLPASSCERWPVCVSSRPKSQSVRMSSSELERGRSARERERTCISFSSSLFSPTSLALLKLGSLPPLTASPSALRWSSRTSVRRSTVRVRSAPVAAVKARGPEAAARRSCERRKGPVCVSEGQEGN